MSHLERTSSVSLAGPLLAGTSALSGVVRFREATPGTAATVPGGAVPSTALRSGNTTNAPAGASASEIAADVDNRIVAHFVAKKAKMDAKGIFSEEINALRARTQMRCSVGAMRHQGTKAVAQQQHAEGARPGSTAGHDQEEGVAGGVASGLPKLGRGGATTTSTSILKTTSKTSVGRTPSPGGTTSALKKGGLKAPRSASSMLEGTLGFGGTMGTAYTSLTNASTGSRALSKMDQLAQGLDIAHRQCVIDEDLRTRDKQRKDLVDHARRQAIESVSHRLPTHIIHAFEVKHGLTSSGGQHHHHPHHHGSISHPSGPSEASQTTAAGASSSHSHQQQQQQQQQQASHHPEGGVVLVADVPVVQEKDDDEGVTPSSHTTHTTRRTGDGAPPDPLADTRRRSQHRSGDNTSGARAHRPTSASEIISGTSAWMQRSLEYGEPLDYEEETRALKHFRRSAPAVQPHRAVHDTVLGRRS